MPSRILVVSFSRTGSTARVAAHLAKSLGGDLDTIEEVSSRRGLGGYVRSLLESLAKGLPAIRTRCDPRDYDLVVLGSPVWAGTMASPVRAYLHQHREALAKTAFFAVMGGRGGDDTVQEMQLACGVTDRPTCVFTQDEVQHDRHRARCDEFVQRIQDRAVGKVTPVRVAA